MRLIYLPHVESKIAMYLDQIFTLLMLIVAVLAAALVVGSVRSYWRRLRVRD
jgi:hypothetical protein